MRNSFFAVDRKRSATDASLQVFPIGVVVPRHGMTLALFTSHQSLTFASPAVVGKAKTGKPVIDDSKYLNRLVEVDSENRPVCWANGT